MKSKYLRDCGLFIAIVTIQFLTSFIARPMFETTDDLTIISILYGHFGYSAYADGMFISKILSQLLFILYDITYLPWYSILLYFLQAISLLLLLKMILIVVSGKHLKMIVIIALFVLYQYLFVRLNFSSTSLLLCFATSSYIGMKALINDKLSIKEMVIAILFSVSFLIRPDLSYMYILYTVPMFGLVLINKSRKRILFVFLPIILISAGSLTFDHLSRNTSEFHYFKEMNNARSNFQDTGLGKYNEKTEKALSFAHWTEEDYKLGRIWFMHNEDVYNPERINAFTETNKHKDSQVISFYNLKENLIDIKFIMLFSFLSVISILVIMLNKNESLSRSLSFPKTYFYFSLLYGLLGTLGIASIRFPSRISVPLCLYLFMLVILFSPYIGKKVSKKYVYRLLTAGGFALVVVTGVTNQYIFQYSTTHPQQVSQSIEKVMFSNGADTIFVEINPHSFSQFVHPLKELKDIPHYNRLPLGWGIGSPQYYTFLNQYGVKSGKEFIDHSINNDHVIYSFYENENMNLTEMQSLFKAYLNNRHALPDKQITFDTYYTDILPNGKRQIYFKLVSK